MCTVKTMNMILGLSANLSVVSLFSVKYVVGTYWNRFQCVPITYVYEAIPMCTYYNIYFFEKIKGFTISFS